MEAIESGIDFSNDLVPNVATQENLLDFDYFYNGAGVGIADINNDGLPDIFFCGNQVDNQLYLNKGNLKFENITEVSGINQNKHWSNGVTFVDVNNDGWLDIYVSQGGPKSKGDRGNLLYINNKNATFIEQAAEYGLADQGISTQSAFFDFDNDGDMDCIVMNESTLYGYDPITFHRLLLENQGDTYTGYSHFYRNDDGKFVDVTIESGITSPTFGLGLAISDFNDDGWLDIYIANDYYQPDNIYINKKNGTFSDRSKVHLSQMSFFGMGMDVADINNDGHQDLFVLDMASKDHVRSKTLMASMDTESFDLLVNKFGFPHQYMFNALQLNDGRGVFKNIAQMAGVAKTDWSWAALMEDFDNDGLRDIFVTNGYRKYGTDNDFKKRVESAKKKYQGKVPLEVKKSLYASIPSEKIANNLFQQTDDLKFEEMNMNWGLQDPTYSNGAATADFDGDGDLDIIINNIDEKAHLYENKSVDVSNKNFINFRLAADKDQYARVTLRYNDEVQVGVIRRVRGYMSSVEPMAHFGLGDVVVIDKVEVRFQSGEVSLLSNVEVNQTIDVSSFDTKKQEAEQKIKSKSKLTPILPIALGIDYKHQENKFDDFKKEILLPYKQSTLGPCTAVADINGDGIDDVYIGGAYGQQGHLYISNNASYDQSYIGEAHEELQFEDVSAVFFDLEGDGDLDLIVLSGGNEWPASSSNYSDRLYIQDEFGNFRRDPSSIISNDFYVGGAISTIDFDNDGDLDIIRGNRIVPQMYPLPAPSTLFENKNGVLVEVTEKKAASLKSIGIVNDIEVIDANHDGWMDFMVVGEWEEPVLFKNKQGAFDTQELTEAGKGLWFSITSLDVNGDGKKDFVLGNIGENYKLKASSDNPVKIFASDLDKNGTHDLVLSTKYNGEYVPVRGKECSSQQLPFVSEKFESYESFASSSLVDVYGDENLDKSYKREITSTKSTILLNNGDFNFTIKSLPKEIQSFPLLDGASVDVNQDGLDDLVTIGTIYDTEVETPRLDGGSGLVLLNTGTGLSVDKEEYYLYIKGDVKTIDVLKRLDSKRSLLVSRNNDKTYLLDIVD